MKVLAIIAIAILSILIPLFLIVALSAIRMSGLCSEEERKMEEDAMRKMENKENKE